MPKASAPTSGPTTTQASTARTPRASSQPAPANIAGLTFTDLDDTDEHVKALLFGTESTGKTSSLAHLANLPGDGITLVINAEAGLKKGSLRALGVDTSKIKIWPEPGVHITYESLDALYFQLSAMLREDPKAIKGVGLDSLTEIVLKILESASHTMYEREQRNSRKAEEDKRFSAEVTQLEDYGLMTSQVRKLMRKFRDLPCHFVATALETEAQGEGEFSHARSQRAPEMTPKLRSSVLGYVDLALRFTSETLPVSATESVTLVTARTKPSALVRGKDRYGLLPRDLPNPTFDRIVKYVTGELTAENDPTFGEYANVRDRAEEYKARKKEAQKAA